MPHAHKKLALLRLLDKLESLHPFSEGEAWVLFRVVAIAEAVGWAVLISGVAIQRYHLPGSHYAIPIAGQIHGTIFLAYFGILIATYSSQGWSRLKFLTAIAAGVPPFGTLIFEIYAAYTRRNKYSRRHFSVVYLSYLAQVKLQ